VQEITSRHPNPFYLTPKAVFEVAELSARIPSLALHAMVVEFVRIAALIGDGHTRATIPPTGGVLPIELEWLDDAWRIVRTSKPYANLLGVRVSGLDATDIATAGARVTRLVSPHESPGFSRYSPGAC
jgi:hypothetical protein